MAIGIRKITTAEAVVRTATVEIKTLTLSGKQITMGVFRQIQDEDLTDWNTGRLRGHPWGRVNYFWGDCKPNHLHVVWQTGEELRRACAYGPSVPAWRIRQATEEREDVERIIGHATGLWLVLRHFDQGQDSDLGRWLQNTTTRTTPYPFHWTGQHESARLKLELATREGLLSALRAWELRQESFRRRRETVSVERPATPEEMKFATSHLRRPGVRWESRPETDEEYRERLHTDDCGLYAQLEGAIQEAAKRSGHLLSLTAGFALARCRGLLAKRQKLIQEEVQFREQYCEGYRQLEALDQLFIAV